MARKPKFEPKLQTEKYIPDAAGLAATHPLPMEKTDFLSDVEADVQQLANDHNAQVDEKQITDDPTLPLDQFQDQNKVVAEVADLMPEEPATVSSTAPNDPNSTMAAFLLATGQVYNEMGRLSVAATGLLPKAAAFPELHAFIMNIQMMCGEFVHRMDQVDGSLSDQLRQAIADAVAA